MPLPLILGGLALGITATTTTALSVGTVVAGAGALGAGIAGLKKSNDAKNDLDSAQRLVRNAKRKFSNKKNKLIKIESTTKELIIDFGNNKVKIYNEFVKEELLPVLLKFKDKVSLSDLKREDVDFNTVIKDLKYDVKIAETIIDGAIEGISRTAGLWAVAGNWLGKTTGTIALSTISNSIATTTFTSAAAWMGVSSFTASAFPPAMLALGPVLAVSGFSMARKAEKTYYEAREYCDKLEIKCETINSMIDNYKVLTLRVNELESLISNLVLKLKECTKQLNDIYNSKKVNILTYLFFKLFRKKIFKLTAEQEKKLINTILLARSLKTLFDVSLIDKDGNVNKKLAYAIEEFS